MPPDYRGRTAALLTDIEQLAVEPDQPARVLVDEQSGIIVMGDDVRISRVAVAQGNLTVRITELPQVSQPNPLAEGDTVVVPRTRVEVDEGGGRNMVVPEEGVSLQDAGRRAQRARRRAARPDQHPAGDQGGRRAAGRDRGDVMSDAIQVQAPAPAARSAGSRQARRRRRACAQAAQEFEAVFLAQVLAQLNPRRPATARTQRRSRPLSRHVQ